MSPALREHIETDASHGQGRQPEHGRDRLPSTARRIHAPQHLVVTWNAIRAAAGMPGQDFYELKHRAIQWMVDPVEDGGLGLDSRDRRRDGRPRRRRLSHRHRLHQARPSVAPSPAHSARWTPTSSATTPPTLSRRASKSCERQADREMSERPDKELMAFGVSIREAREAKAMTPAELATASNIDQQTWKRSKPDGSLRPRTFCSALGAGTPRRR